MPQGERTPADKARFKWMLQNVNLLYLGCSVLCLVDISYLSRFWVRRAARVAARGGARRSLTRRSCRARADAV